MVLWKRFSIAKSWYINIDKNDCDQSSEIVHSCSWSWAIWLQMFHLQSGWQHQCRLGKSIAKAERKQRWWVLNVNALYSVLFRLSGGKKLLLHEQPSFQWFLVNSFKPNIHDVLCKLYTCKKTPKITKQPCSASPRKILIGSLILEMIAAVRPELCNQFMFSDAWGVEL